MVSTDALADAYYADRDPQYQDPDAYDKEIFLDQLAAAQDYIDSALGALHNAKEEHETSGVDKIIRLLTEAMTRLEDEL